MGAQGTRVAAAVALLWLTGCGLAPDSKSTEDGGGRDDPTLPLFVNGCDLHGRPFGAGDGSLGRPFLLCAPEHLQAVAAHDDSPVHFRMATDIDVPHGFRTGMMGLLNGSFDGDQHVITGLSALPLIDVSSGTVANVILRDVDLSGSYRMGGLLGQNLVGARVSHCHVTGKMQVAYTSGGLVGFNEGDIEDSSANVTLTGTNRAGGLVGYNRGDIRRSQARGSIRTESGIAGGLVAEHNAGRIEDSFSLATVEGPRQVGGLVGIGAAAVARTYAAGLVVSTDPSSGGLIGENSGTVTASYWDTDASQQSASAGGEGRTSVDLRNVSTFIGWNFVAVWKMPSANPPELR